MFDFHLHTSISFDSDETPSNIIAAAKSKGLKEICFTDHYDLHRDRAEQNEIFTLNDYAKQYDHLKNDGIVIRRGVELGLTEWNVQQAQSLLQSRPFDFCIGSVHYVNEKDPYYKEYWDGLTAKEAFEKYLLKILECVKLHDDFDVLGHLSYVARQEHNPTGKPLQFSEVSDITDEIMKVLVQKGKGMEINTSGVDKIGDFLPSKDFFVRFRELGGEIVTVGSDAHSATRVGQYVPKALEIIKDVFGFVCTFDSRIPQYHKL